jgi:hypothetical protein
MKQTTMKKTQVVKTSETQRPPLGIWKHGMGEISFMADPGIKMEEMRA